MASSHNHDSDTTSPQVPPEPPRRRRRISHVAVASFMIGLLSLFGLLTLPLTITHWDVIILKWLLWPPNWSLGGFVLGLLAILSIGRSGERLSGKGYAYAGTIISALVLCLVVPLWVSMFYPAYLRERDEPARRTCYFHIFVLGAAAREYANDHAGRLPPADTWCDALLPYLGSRQDLVCPAAPKLKCGYAYNRALSSRLVSSIADPEHTVLFYESDLGWNGAGGPDTVVRRARHFDVIVYRLVDGHTRPIHEGVKDDFVWNPGLGPTTTR
jgi:hypothetical protein